MTMENFCTQTYVALLFIVLSGCKPKGLSMTQGLCLLIEERPQKEAELFKGTSQGDEAEYLQV